MNEVSWLIYLSNLSGNLHGYLIFLGIVISAIAVVYFITSLVIFSNINRWDTPEIDDHLTKVKNMRKPTPILVGIAFLIWTISACCPSQDTVLAIAASEVGEQMLHTQTASLAEQALNSWLKNQITPAPTTPAQ